MALRGGMVSTSKPTIRCDGPTWTVWEFARSGEVRSRADQIGSRISVMSGKATRIATRIRSVATK